MSAISKISTIANNTISATGKKVSALFTKTNSQTIDTSKLLLRTSECLDTINRAQIVSPQKSGTVSPDLLRSMTKKYSQSDLQIAQTKQDVIGYLNSVLDRLDAKLETATPENIEDILAEKAVVDYLSQNIGYTRHTRSLDEICGFVFGLPTKRIDSSLRDFNEEFAKSVQLFKKEGILDISMYNPKKHQFDAENIMDKYSKKEHELNGIKYREIFSPIQRMRSVACNDPFLSDDANFYRIISPDELVSLFRTKGTDKLIDSNGHFTNGHYSCVTTNPNYNEQAFTANGLPIRLKFKTKGDDGLYNMDLLNRIAPLKQERSIYRVWGYNYSDIDWDNVCVDAGCGWAKLDKKTLDELMGMCQ